MLSAAEGDESQALLVSTFYLGDKSYGLPTTHVQEIVRFRGVTPVHHAPPFILGVVNLRGKIVTVFDLAARTGLGRLAQTSEGRVIIFEWHGEHVGLLVDDVIDVFPVEPTSIAQVPANMPEVQSTYLLGILSHEGRLIPILNEDAVLGDDESPHGASHGALPDRKG
ncbi:MAG: purine-binding chemotaxis protein CheW [Deltaproteobacteria bacterium]|nr:purine-binding chemotaxis protein CheW [Deltaproteobacteria bacterium]